MQYQVTALVSTYNSSQWLPGCLDNLLSQTLADRLQIVVVDSGSEPEERERVESYQRVHPNIDYLRTGRETLYASWNRAVQVARGSYLTSSNTDDRLCPHALERLALALERDPKLALVYADNWETNDPEAVRSWNGLAGPHRRVRRGPYSRRRLALNCICGPQPMWRRDLHERFGFFDESLEVCGDWDFWLRVSEAAPMLHLDEPLGLYFRNHQGLELVDPERALREAQQIRLRFFGVS